jgi:hypothetical protein
MRDDFDYRETVKAIEQQYSEFAKFYPRRYQNIGAFHSPKLPAAWFSLATVDGVSKSLEPAAHSVFLSIIGQSMARIGMPLMFVDPQFLAAIRASDFDMELNLRPTKLPYEHGVLMFPTGAVTADNREEAACIAWGRITAGTYTIRERPITIEEEIFFYAALSLPEFSETFRQIPLDAPFNPRWSTGDEKYADLPDDYERMDVDKDFLNDLGCILFATFLALEARPALLSHGQKLRPASVLRSHEWWSPNIIGKGYRPRQAQPEGEPGHHASPRMHWRRGHFRSQAHGSQRAERKTIWLEPMLIAATDAGK